MFKKKLKKTKSKQDWKSLCESTPEHVCDFSSVQLHYLGVWLLRLRAQSGQTVSPWVEKEFCPDRDGKISLIYSKVLLVGRRNIPKGFSHLENNLLNLARGFRELCSNWLSFKRKHTKLLLLYCLVNTVINVPADFSGIPLDSIFTLKGVPLLNIAHTSLIKCSVEK